MPIFQGWHLGSQFQGSLDLLLALGSSSVIRRECGQTLGLELVDRNRTVVNY